MFAHFIARCPCCQLMSQGGNCNWTSKSSRAETHMLINWKKQQLCFSNSGEFEFRLLVGRGMEIQIHVKSHWIHNTHLPIKVFGGRKMDGARDWRGFWIPEGKRNCVWLGVWFMLFIFFKLVIPMWVFGGRSEQLDRRLVYRLALWEADRGNTGRKWV